MARTLNKLISSDVFEITEPRKRRYFTIILDMIFNRKPKINPLNISFQNYDHVLLLAPVWNMSVAHPMKTFIRKYKEKLSSFSFATVCIGREGQEKALNKQLLKLSGHEPHTLEEFKINDLVPLGHRNKPKYVSNYRLKPNEIIVFENKIQQLLCKISNLRKSLMAA